MCINTHKILCRKLLYPRAESQAILPPSAKGRLRWQPLTHILRYRTYIFKANCGLTTTCDEWEFGEGSILTVLCCLIPRESPQTSCRECGLWTRPFGFWWASLRFSCRCVCLLTEISNWTFRGLTQWGSLHTSQVTLYHTHSLLSSFPMIWCSNHFTI